MKGLEKLLKEVLEQEQEFTDWAKEGTIKESMKLLLDNFRARTYLQLMQADPMHSQNNRELRELEQVYDGLKMDEATKEVTDALFSKKNEIEFDIANNSYLAGVIDTYRMMKYMGWTEM